MRKPGGRAVVAGEQPHFLGDADAVDDRVDGSAGKAGQISILPAFLHAGERQLHAGYVRDDLELILAQAIAQVPGHPVKQGVAVIGEHGTAGGKRLADLSQRGGHVGVEHDLAGV